MQVIKHEIVLITVFEIKIQKYNKLLDTVSLNTQYSFIWQWIKIN